MDAILVLLMEIHRPTIRYGSSELWIVTTVLRRPVSHSYLRYGPLSGWAGLPLTFTFSSFVLSSRRGHRVLAPMPPFYLFGFITRLFFLLGFLVASTFSLFTADEFNPSFIFSDEWNHVIGQPNNFNGTISSTLSGTVQFNFTSEI